MPHDPVDAIEADTPDWRREAVSLIPSDRESVTLLSQIMGNSHGEGRTDLPCDGSSLSESTSQSTGDESSPSFMTLAGVLNQSH